MKIFSGRSILRSKVSAFIASALAFISFLASAEAASVPEPLPAPSMSQATTAQFVAPISGLPLKVLAVRPERASMGEKITVEVDGLSTAIKQGKEKFDPTRLILYFDGYPLKGVYPDSIDPIRSVLTFTPVRNEENKDSWTALIGSPKSYFRPLNVSVGFGDQYPLATDVDRRHFQFIVARQNWFAVGTIALLLMVGSFIWLARISNIIRDSSPPLPGPGKKKPYSLAKLQASVWFFLVVASFLFIWLVTGDYTNTVTEQALILIGLGTGTALGAAMIDANKHEVSDDERAEMHPKESKLDAEVQELKAKIASLQAKAISPSPNHADDIETFSRLKIELAQKEAQLDDIQKKITDAAAALSKPVSEGFISDLLTDANGISFHRFQMLAWTIILGLIFCIEVYKTLRMPEFSTTLLSLMGISAGTYLGFKIPERSG